MFVIEVREFIPIARSYISRTDDYLFIVSSAFSPRANKRLIRRRHIDNTHRLSKQIAKNTKTVLRSVRYVRTIVYYNKTIRPADDVEDHRVVFVFLTVGRRQSSEYRKPIAIWSPNMLNVFKNLKNGRYRWRPKTRLFSNTTT